MTRHVRSWAIAALAAFALAGAATPSLAGITYNVTNYAAGQNGWSLAGTITVSAAGTYTNDLSAITAWDITLSKPSTGSYQFTNTLTDHDGITLLGTLTASAGTLDFAGGFFNFNGQGGRSLIDWQQNYSDYSGFVDNAQVFNSQGFSPTNSNGWTIGTATPSAVPEIDPAMGSSALSLVAGVLAMIEQRRRRAAIVA
jgi:hypothetical protein